MKYGYLGSSGLKISKLSYGSWVTFGHQLDAAGAAEVMAAAKDHGCNFFDNAEVYADGQSEELMGEALRKLDWSRDSYLVSTKIFWGGDGPNQRGLSRKHIVEGTMAALRRLQLDYVDLIFCHRPDPNTPIEETVRAMNHVIDRGWAFYWGTSEWSADQLREAWRIARENGLIGPTMEQPQYHMFHRERVEQEYAGLVRDFGLGTTTWSPLASGFLTGKYNDGVPEGSRLALENYDWLKDSVMGDQAFEDKVEKVRKLTAMAKDLGGSMAQLALAWTAQHPHVSTVITGSSKTSQLHENFGAVELFDKLTPEVMAEIEAVLGNQPKPPRDMRDG